MTQYTQTTCTSGLDYDHTLILAIELSSRSWVVAVQTPRGWQKATKQQIAPQANALMATIEGYQRRAGAAVYRWSA
jgi:transposase